MKVLRSAWNIIKNPSYLLEKKKAAALEKKIAKEKAELAHLELNFNFIEFKTRLTSYLESMKKNSEFGYHFSGSSPSSHLYSNICAYLIKGLIEDKISDEEKDQLKNYLHKHQSEDGLLRDDICVNNLSETEDHYGWRHITAMSIAVYDYFNITPKFDFRAIYAFYEKQSMSEWLESLEWEQDAVMASNRIFNAACLLLYSNQVFKNSKGKELVNQMTQWLLENKVDTDTGLWGGYEVTSPHGLHMALNTTYHIYPIYEYIGEVPPFIQKVGKHLLSNQQPYGGFGTGRWANACDDIDTGYLMYLAKQTELHPSIKKSLSWLLYNQNEDGGFSFVKDFPTAFGEHQLLIQSPNESNMLSTWFRSVNIAYLADALQLDHSFKFCKAPGYQYK